ncbi:uncharacterized protein [Diabrotica undecimpunctata]|uniref:uncharacterized protein n=1 Tax=Diabrotica undecimpunctata TaxID=50387 RepID=UPI003B64159E
MILGNTEQKEEGQFTFISNENFERVVHFTYLEVIIEEKGHREWKLNARFAKENKKMGSLRPVMKFNYLSRKTKLRIYKPVIRPTVTYGSEVWTIEKENTEKLKRWERKILRPIYGGKNTMV